MSRIKFAHIAPTHYLDDLVSEQQQHLLLAHLVESDVDYRDWYATQANGLKILDNSCFELFKEGKPMFPSEKLMNLADIVSADYIVMSDYPGERSAKTIKAAEELGPRFKAAGFGTFFVPQSEVGDLEDLIAGFAWAAHSPLVDYIGVSILGIPNGYGVESGNKLQRYLSRAHFLAELKKRGILAAIKRNKKKVHFLGMVDGPNEIALVRNFNIIDTWDSSAAAWLALRGDREFDRSPTGLIDGKYEVPVDFSYTDGADRLMKARRNMNYINNLCNGGK